MFLEVRHETRIEVPKSGHPFIMPASVLKIVMPWEEICIIIIDLNTLLVALVETYFNFAHSSAPLLFSYIQKLSNY
jgi:hypothetical protein